MFRLSSMPAARYTLAGALLSSLYLIACGIQVQGTPSDDDDASGDTTGTPDITDTSTPANLPQFLLEVEPQSVRFGSVTIGQTEEAIIAFYNGGSTAVHPDHIEFTPSSAFFAIKEFNMGGLQMTSLPEEIAAGATLSATVAFNPGQASTFNVAMSLVTKENLENIEYLVPTVTLTGRGVQPTP